MSVQTRIFGQDNRGHRPPFQKKAARGVRPRPNAAPYLGVPPEAVEVLGVLDDFPTVSRFAVTPFAGIIPHPFPY